MTTTTDILEQACEVMGHARNPNMGFADVAAHYKTLIKMIGEVGSGYAGSMAGPVNDVIIDRWGREGLNTVKTLAWSMIEEESQQKGPTSEQNR